MTLPPQRAQRPTHDAAWRQWSAEKRQRIIGLPKAALVNAVNTEDFESLTEEDRAAVLKHLAAPAAPDLAYTQTVAPRGKHRAAPNAKATAQSGTPTAADRRPLPLKSHGKKYGPRFSVHLWLCRTWPWVLPLLAVTFWASTLLIGHELVLQYSAVG